ncbi:phage major capsid protein [Fructobacillus cardui]|uniref:phage major capsid protein n=1 Tax=Fructobacillus cardui TaxID=2893170 RepID=UPI002DAEAC15|nr:Predicted phage phi-C31 gp36 major capsid-like protein (gp36) [Fructobacillus cardui]
MKLNELRDVYTDAGNKVSDLRAEMQAMAINDDVTVEQIEAKKAEVENAVAKRDLAKENLKTAEEEMAIEVKNTEKKPLTDKEISIKDKFVKDFKDMIKGKTTIVNQLNSSTDENGNQIGLTIPQDIQTTIISLVRQYDPLQNEVNVVSVSTLTGSRVIEALPELTPLANLDAEDAEIEDMDDPKLSTIKYVIKRYAGMTEITNTLMADTAENILAWLSDWIAKKVLVTRNKAIIGVLPSMPKKATISTFDDVKDMAIKELDPAIAQTAKFFTNQSGFAILSKYKDGNGDYLIQPDAQQADAYVMDGKQIKVISDTMLPSLNGSMPLVFGDLKQAITLFDRNQMSLRTFDGTDRAATHDVTQVRIIDRFDVKSVDNGAVVVGSFKTIADSSATSSSEATK